MTGENMADLKRDYPIGAVIAGYIHAPDSGTLIVSGYGTIHSIYVVTMRCAVCGQDNLDVSDYEAVVPSAPAHVKPPGTRG